MRINVEKIDCQNGKKQIFTRGYSYSSGAGINWGRTAWGNGNAHRKGIELDAALIHEGTHWQQQRSDDFANFYGTTAKNYTQSIMKYGTTNPLYDGTFLPYNYEHKADQNELNYANSKGYTRRH